jgi:putative ABC transport system permease protein
MGIPLLRGRTFTDSDTATSPRAAIVNRTFADRFFGGSPIGHRISFVFTGAAPWEIAGVVGDEQVADLDRETMPVVYLVEAQDSNGAFSIVVRSASPESLTPAIRNLAREMDPTLPVYNVRTMERLMAESTAVFQRRMVVMLLGVFALATLVLSAIGVYGVLAQAVAARTREIGLRIALGADRADIVRLVARRGLVPALTGIGVGLPLALGLGQLLRALLYDVAPTDAPTLAAVVILVTGVGILAAIVPARRAMHIDPAQAIRQE